MKNLSFIVTLILIIGIIMGLYLNFSIALFVLIIIFIILMLFYKNKKNLLIYTFILVISISYTYARKYEFENRYADIENVNMIVKILNVESVNDYYITYKSKVIKTKHSENSYRYTSGYVLIKIKKDYVKKNKIDFGDEVLVIGNVSEMETKRNYKGFNYKHYLYSNNVYAIIKSDSIKTIKKNRNIIYKMKNYIVENMKEKLDVKDYSICLATLIGYKAEIPENIKEVFQECNLSHLLAISGMHVSIIISIVSSISKKFSKNKSRIFNISVLVIYILLVGNVTSVIRACLMQILVLFGDIIHKRSSNLSNLSISAIILLIINPFTILNIGFIFSFTGTLSIIIFYNIVKSIFDHISVRISVLKKEDLPKNESKVHTLIMVIMRYVVEIIIVSISANILLIPISIYYSNSFSMIFLVSNIIAQPVLTCIVFLSLIKIIISIVNLDYFIKIDVLIHFILKLFLNITEVISKIPCSKITVSTPNIITIVIIYLIIIGTTCIYKNESQKKYVYNLYLKIFKCFSNKFRILIAILLILVCIFNFIFIRSSNKNLSIYFVDVGQGDCTLIVTKNNKRILIDGGGSINSKFDIGKKTLIPYLLDRKIKYLDYIMVSHFDFDHVRSE